MGRGGEKCLIKGGVGILRGICETDLVKCETDLVIFSKVFNFIPENLPKNMFLTSKIDEILRIRG